MSYAQARELLASLEANDTESNLEAALEVIDIYGTCRNAMIQAVKINYKRKDELLYALLGNKAEVDVSPVVKKISTKMHGINRRISDDAEAKGEDYFKLLKAAKIKESFDLDDLEVWVLNDIGGRETISKVNYFEPNSLNTKIENSVKKYYNRVENNSMQAIAGLADMKRLEK